QAQDKHIAAIRHEDAGGFDLMSSSEPSRGAAVFIGDALALGPRSQLMQLIEAHRSGQSLKATPQFAAASPSRSLPPAPLVSLSSVREESNEMMVTLARFSGITLIPAQPPALAQLPPAVNATSLKEQGLFVEARSPFGNLPFLVSLVGGVGNDPTSR